MSSRTSWHDTLPLHALPLLIVVFHLSVLVFFGTWHRLCRLGLALPFWSFDDAFDHGCCQQGPVPWVKEPHCFVVIYFHQDSWPQSAVDACSKTHYRCCSRRRRAIHNYWMIDQAHSVYCAFYFIGLELFTPSNAQALAYLESASPTCDGSL